MALVDRWFQLSVLRFAAHGTSRTLLPVAAGAAAVIMLLRDQGSIGLLGFSSMVSLSCLLFAIPHATSRLIDLDRDGRLDQLRLAGKPPTSTLWTLLLGLAAPFLIAAVILGLPVITGPRLEAADYVVIALAWVATLMLSIVSLALPRGRPIDTHLVTIGLVTIVGTTAALVLGDARVTPKELFSILANRVNSSSETLSTVLLLAMGLSIAVVLTHVMGNIARPATMRMPRRRGAFRRWQSPAGAAAEFWRGARLVLLSSIGATVITIVSLVVLFVVITPDISSAYTFVPVLVGAFVVSNTNRLDRESGRLDVLRLAPVRPYALLSLFTLGQWAPFVVATVLGQLTLRLLSRAWLRVDESPATAMSFVVFVGSIAPLAAIEGWRRRWPLVYLIPAGFGFMSLGGDTWTAVARQASVAWIPWIVLARTFRRPDAPPLSGLLGVASLAAITVAALWRITTAALVFDGGERVAVVGAIALLLVSLIASSSRRSSRDWVPGVVAGSLTGVMVSMGPLRVIDRVLLSSVPMAAWWAGLRLHDLARGGRWSLPLRATSAAALMASANDWVHLLMIYFEFASYEGQLVTWQHGLLVALVLTVTLLIELVFRARERSSRTVVVNDRRSTPPP